MIQAPKLESRITRHEFDLALIPRRLATHIGNPQHIGRARRAERHAGDRDDALAGLGEAFAEGDAAGAVDHVVLVAGVLGNDAMHAPHHRQPAAGRDIGRDRDDRRARALARHPQRGRAGGGPAHHRGEIERVGDVAGGRRRIGCFVSPNSN